MDLLRSCTYFLLIISLTGCISTYELPNSEVDTSSVKLEKRDGEIPKGGVIGMYKVGDDFVCRPGQGLVGQTQITGISRSRFGIGKLNENGLRVQAVPNLRFLVRSVSATGVSLSAGSIIGNYLICDVLLAITTEKNKSYKVLSSFNEQGCHVRVIESSGESEIYVAPTEYQEC